MLQQLSNIIKLCGKDKRCTIEEGTQIYGEVGRFVIPSDQPVCGMQIKIKKNK